MVSLNDHTTQNVVQPAQAVEDSFGEQFFPQELSWYAAEGPQGIVETGARKVRENPWAAVGIALAAGVVVALFAGPLIRAGVRGLELAADMGGPDSDESEACADQEAAGESACDSSPDRAEAQAAACEE